MIRYGIILEKGYQKTGGVAGVVTTKLKGAWVYNGTEDFTQNCDDPVALTTAPWDIADLVIPPEVSSGAVLLAVRVSVRINYFIFLRNFCIICIICNLTL